MKKLIISFIFITLLLNLKAQSFKINSSNRWNNQITYITINNDSIITLKSNNNTIILTVLNYWESENAVSYDVVDFKNHFYSFKLLSENNIYKLIVDKNNIYKLEIIKL